MNTQKKNIKIKRIVISFRLSAFAFSLIGLLETTGVLNHNFEIISLLAYTTLSNLLVALLFIWLLIKTFHVKIDDSTKNLNLKTFGFYPRISAFVTVAIFVTLIIFWGIIVPMNTKHTILTFNNMSVHLITPLLMFTDYILFNERGKLKKYDMFYNLVIPICYAVGVIIIGMSHKVVYPFFEEDSFYPYPFLDVDKYGIKVLFIILGIALFFLMLGVIWKFIDNKLSTNSTN